MFTFLWNGGVPGKQLEEIQIPHNLVRLGQNHRAGRRVLNKQVSAQIGKKKRWGKKKKEPQWQCFAKKRKKRLHRLDFFLNWDDEVTENAQIGFFTFFFLSVLDGGRKFSPKLYQRCSAIQFKVMREIFAILSIKTYCKL